MKKAFFWLFVFNVSCALPNSASAAPLHDAVKAGDLAKTRQLIEAGADVDAKDEQSYTPLHRAVEQGSREITQLLLDHKAEVASVGGDGNTPLHIAAAKGRRKAIALLLEHDVAELNIHNKDDRTPLDLAIQEGRIATVEDLLNAGAHTGIGEPDDEGGYTWSDDALAVALAAGKKDMVNLLLKKGAAIESQHLYGTPKPSQDGCAYDRNLADMIAKLRKGQVRIAGSTLAAALMCGDRPLMESLMRSAATIEYNEITGSLAGSITSTHLPNTELFNELFAADREIKAHATALFSNYAAAMVYSRQANDNSGYATFLLNKGADASEKDETGNTLLHRAAETGNVGMVRFLVEHGANPNAATEWGNTPLFRAILAGNIEIVKYLTEHGANVNAANELGNTPLHFAAARNMTEISEVLIKKGAKVNVKNQAGNTPLHQSVRFPAKFNTAALLLRNGASANAQNGEGYTALHCAAIRNVNADDENGENQIYYRTLAPYEVSEVLADDNDLINLAKDLLKHKADLRAKDAGGDTAVDLALGNDAHDNFASYLEAQLKKTRK